MNRPACEARFASAPPNPPPQLNLRDVAHGNPGTHLGSQFWTVVWVLQEPRRDPPVLFGGVLRLMNYSVVCTLT